MTENTFSTFVPPGYKVVRDDEKTLRDEIMMAVLPGLLEELREPAMVERLRRNNITDDKAFFCTIATAYDIADMAMRARDEGNGNG